MIQVTADQTILSRNRGLERSRTRTSSSGPSSTIAPQYVRKSASTPSVPFFKDSSTPPITFTRQPQMSTPRLIDNRPTHLPQISEPKVAFPETPQTDLRRAGRNENLRQQQSTKQTPAPTVAHLAQKTPQTELKGLDRNVNRRQQPRVMHEPRSTVAFPAQQTPDPQAELQRKESKDRRTASKIDVTSSQPLASLNNAVATKIIPQQKVVAAGSSTDKTDLVEEGQRVVKPMPRLRRDSMVLAKAMIDQIGASTKNIDVPPAPEMKEITPDELERYVV